MHVGVQGYYDEEGDSEMSESQADEEVAVTKRGRAVKLPAKYKAEVCYLPISAQCAHWEHICLCYFAILSALVIITGLHLSLCHTSRWKPADGSFNIVDMSPAKHTRAIAVDAIGLFNAFVNEQVK